MYHVTDVGDRSVALLLLPLAVLVVVMVWPPATDRGSQWNLAGMLSSSCDSEMLSDLSGRTSRGLAIIIIIIIVSFIIISIIIVVSSSISATTSSGVTTAPVDRAVLATPFWGWEWQCRPGIFSWVYYIPYCLRMKNFVGHIVKYAVLA